MITLHKIDSTIFAILFLTFFTYSCGSQVETTKLTTKDMDSYETYAWLPEDDTATSNKYDKELVRQTVVDEVNEQMEKHGYQLDRKKPDLLVLTHTMLDKETEIQREPVYSSYHYYHPNFHVHPYYEPYYYHHYNHVPRIVGYEIEQISYTEGTLVIDLIDSETNNIVWRGRAEDYIAPENVSAEVRDYVKAIFDKFPTDGEHDYSELIQREYTGQ